MIGGICFLFLFGYSGIQMNRFIEPKLEAIVQKQVGQALNQMVQLVVSQVKIEPNVKELIKDEEGKITGVHYDAQKLSKYLYESIALVETSLAYAKEGKKDPNLQQVVFPEGTVYECPIGYFSGISFLSEMGFRIPIKLKTLNHVKGDIAVESQSYGLNNTLIKVNFVLEVEATTMSLLKTTVCSSKTEIPIAVQMIQGEIPSYIPYQGNESFIE